MKKAKYLTPFRFYRNVNQSHSEISFQVIVEETDLWIKAQKDLSSPILTYVQQLRAQIKAYIDLHPSFLTALSPLPLDPNAPLLIQEMLKTAQIAKVGPMATVAGAIAEAVAKKFSPLSPNLIVENGGDTYLCSTQERIVGVWTGTDQEICLGIRIRPDEFPCSLCASSGRIGHSLNFGQSDLVVVKARSGALADGLATYLSNHLHTKKDLNRTLNLAKQFTELNGIFIQIQDKIGIWGNLEIVAI